MTLSEAVAEFEVLFEGVTHDERSQERKDVLVTWSGGQRQWGETATALYATEEDAISRWLETAKSVVSGGSLHWVTRPELLKFQITIADRIGQHRAVNGRFAVKSQFVVKIND